MEPTLKEGSVILGLRYVKAYNKGDIIITASPVGSTVSGEDWLKMSHKLHYNLTEIMRRSGATDFFEGWKGTLY